MFPPLVDLLLMLVRLHRHIPLVALGSKNFAHCPAPWARKGEENSQDTFQSTSSLAQSCKPHSSLSSTTATVAK